MSSVPVPGGQWRYYTSTTTTITTTYPVVHVFTQTAIHTED